MLFGSADDATARDAPATTRPEAVPTTSESARPASSEPTVLVVDDSGALSIEVPVGWTDQSGRAWSVDGAEVGVAISAAPDLEAWYSTWGTAGVFVGVSTGDHVPSLGDFGTVCRAEGRSEASYGDVSGEVQSWQDCGDEGSSFWVFVGDGTDGDYAVLVQLVATDPGDPGIDDLMNTLSYIP